MLLAKREGVLSKPSLHHAMVQSIWTIEIKSVRRLNNNSNENTVICSNLYCTTPKEQSKYANIVTPFSTSLWVSYLAALGFVWVILEATDFAQRRLMPLDLKDRNDRGYIFFGMLSIVFNHDNYR